MLNLGALVLTMAVGANSMQARHLRRQAIKLRLAEHFLSFMIKNTVAFACVILGDEIPHIRESRD
ncbi:hypothetical protein [Sphingomonas sp.]|uniref:hypothetical protein n=1 Tax=Sphingomonas sp. TaxID=28214 RepID=UPI003B00FC52